MTTNTTAYGRAAVDLLARQITELKAGNPLAPITVLVPSNYAAVATRRALAARPGGIAAVDFLTLPRLAERLARDTRRPVSPPVLAQAVLEGYIDLLYRDDDGLVIVDYKTDAWRTESELDEKVERYAVQLGAYADAVSVAVDEPVVRPLLVFAAGDGAVREV